MVYHRFEPPVVDGLDFTGYEDAAKQEFKDECDINVVMRKALRTGIFPPAAKVGRYGDFSEVGEYQEALQRVEDARIQFAGLPSRVRERFANDPAKFLAWVNDRKNLKEAADLGLLSEESTKRVVAAPPVPEVKPPA